MERLRPLSSALGPPHHRHFQPWVGQPDAQLPAMRLRHQPAQVQAQADTAAAARARAVGAVEGLSQARQLVGCDAGAVVAQAEGQLPVGFAAQKELRRLRRVGWVAQLNAAKAQRLQRLFERIVWPP